VSVLTHVEVEPRLVVQPRGRPLAAGRVQRDEVGAAVARAEATGHRRENRAMHRGLDRPISTQDPDDAVVLVAAPEPRAVLLGILGREDLRPGAALDVPLVAPG